MITSINNLKTLFLAAGVLALAGCGGGGGGGSSSETAVPTPAAGEIAVQVDKTVLRSGQTYKLVSNQAELTLNPQAAGQVLAARADAPVDANGAPVAGVDAVTTVAVTNASGNAVLMAVSVAGKPVQVNLDTSAEVFVLNTVPLAGVRVTDYAKFSERVRKQPEFARIKTLIEQRIKQGSPCPMSNQCNASAALLAERLAAKVDFSDIVTGEGV